MVETNCWNPADLEGYALGRLPEPQALDLERHFERCASCQQRLEAVHVEDDLLAAVKSQAHAVAGPDPEFVTALIAELQVRMQAEIATAGDDTTASPRSIPTCTFLAPPLAPDELGRLGPYRVLGILGHGGMGIVLRAEDPQLARLVALKVMKPELAAKPLARERFLREARAAAALSHDHVAPVFQVGEDRGVPFFTMPLLAGQSLETRLRERPRLPIADVIRLGRETAEGLAAAHARGLIHRDIKPGNLWLESAAPTQSVAPSDPIGSPAGPADPSAAAGSERATPPGPLPPAGTGRVKILDFGLVHAEAGAGQLTSEGTLLGTPEYMSPEQAAGAEVDPRSDLFSLGCVLYRLCTGLSPFQRKNVMATLSALAMLQPRPPRELNPDVPAALNALILRLLAKRPAERPASARVVAAALRAIEHAQTRSRTAQKRRRWLSAAMLIALGGLVYWAGPVTYRLATNQGEVVVEADDPDVEVRVTRAGSSSVVTVKARSRVTLAAGEYRLEVPAGRHGLTLSPSEVTLRRGGSQVVTVRRLTADHGWLEVQSASGRGKLLVTQAGRPVTFADLSQAGPRLGLAPGTYQLALQDVPQSWQLSRETVTLAARQAVVVEVYPVGEIRRFEVGFPVVAMAVSPDGGWVVTAGGSDREGPSPGSTWSVWDLHTGEKKWASPAPRAPLRAVAVAPRDLRLALAGEDPGVSLWDLDADRELGRLEEHTGAVRAVAFSPDGTQLATASKDQTVRLWELAGLAPARAAETPAVKSAYTLIGHTDVVRCVAFTPDGRRLLSGSYDQTVRVWDVKTGTFVRQFDGHTDRVRCLAVSPDGRRAISGGDDHCARVWEIETCVETACFRGHAQSVGHPVTCVAFSPDGRQAVSTGGTTLCVWQVSSGDQRQRFQGHTGLLAGVAILPDGRRAVTAAQDGTVRLWGLPRD